MKATLTIPENLNEISLVQYQRFLVASEIEGMGQDFLDRKMVSIFCSMSFSDTLQIKQKDIRETCEHLNNLFEGEQAFQQTFKIKDTEFGFIPSLEDITAGEFADLDNYLGDWEHMNKAMAVLYRPTTTKIKDKYLIEDYQGSDKHSELMQFAPLGVVLGAVFFFLNLSKALSKAIQVSLREEMLEESIQLVRSSQQSGDGTAAFTRSLEESLRALLQVSDTEKVL